MTYEERLAKLNPVEAEYRRRMSALTPAERLDRSFKLSQTMHEYLRRRVIEHNPELSGDALALELARALYPQDPELEALLKRATDEL